MLTKEREVQKIEDKAAEELKLKQSQEPETQNVCTTNLKMHLKMPNMMFIREASK